MTPEQEKALNGHIREIAKILHEDTPPEELKSLAGIEQAVRNQVQKLLIDRNLAIATSMITNIKLY